jgi:hypothetical protein
MRTDYAYCLNQDSCIHRRGCKRWIGNYTEGEIKDLYTIRRIVREVNSKECIRDDEDDGKIGFNMLDRFRLSDGTEMKK